MGVLSSWNELVWLCAVLLLIIAVAALIVMIHVNKIENNSYCTMLIWLSLAVCVCQTVLIYLYNNV
jgi:hypothetical protein